MLVVLTAFLPEARPFIEFFGLREQPRIDGGRIFSGPGVLLGVSGQGRKRAATMTRSLLGQLADETVRKEACWLNFGIAGSGAFEIGTMVSANAVRDGESARQWCLQPFVETGYLTGTVLTVSSPSDAYESGAVYEMEASGMVSVLSDQIGPTNVMVVKMISDGPGLPVQDLSAGVVRSLLDRYRSRIEELMAGLLNRLG